MDTGPSGHPKRGAVFQTLTSRSPLLHGRGFNKIAFVMLKSIVVAATARARITITVNEKAGLFSICRRAFRRSEIMVGHCTVAGSMPGSDHIANSLTLSVLGLCNARAGHVRLQNRNEAVPIAERICDLGRG